MVCEGYALIDSWKIAAKAAQAAYEKKKDSMSSPATLDELREASHYAHLWYCAESCLCACIRICAPSSSVQDKIQEAHHLAAITKGALDKIMGSS